MRVHFIRDPSRKRKWYLHCVGPLDTFRGGTAPNWRWRYCADSKKYAKDQINELKLKYNLRPRLEVAELDPRYFNVSLTFKTNAEEAQFLMLSMGEELSVS